AYADGTDSLQTMKNFIRKSVRQDSVLPLLLLLLFVVAARTQAQPAAKPQSSPAQGADVHARVTETQIDSSISDDPAVNQMLAVYAPKVRELETVIGKLTGELRSEERRVGKEWRSRGWTEN